MQDQPGMIAVPVDLLQSVAQLQVPASTNARLQRLMDANNERQLTREERQELAALVEWTEELSLLRSRASFVLTSRAS